MRNWFTTTVKYTKQLNDGTFRRVSEPYLIAAMTHGDAESRIYEELGSLVRGEFMVTGVKRTDFHDIFHYEDADTWYKCKITYEAGGDGLDGGVKAKVVTQNFLVTAHSVKDAYERMKESLGEVMIDYVIPSVTVSPIVDVFPFGDKDGADCVPDGSVSQIDLKESSPKHRGVAVVSHYADEVTEVEFEDDLSEVEKLLQQNENNSVEFTKATVDQKRYT